MGTMPAIKRVNHRHDAIILWLLSNPDRTLGDCAEYFGYTQAWLSRIIHSDMFQAAYRAKAEELGEATVHTIKDKLTRLAAVTLDKSIERVEHGEVTERFLGETMKTTLAAMGYGAQAPTVDARSQSVHVHIDAERIVEARERAAAARAGSTALKESGSPLPTLPEVIEAEGTAA